MYTMAPNAKLSNGIKYNLLYLLITKSITDTMVSWGHLVSLYLFPPGLLH